MFTKISKMLHHSKITFCVGAPRSGTTVVGSLLSEGPSAFPMLPECTFITQLIRQFHDIIYYSDKPRFQAYAKTPTHLAKIFSPAINGLVEAACSHFSHIPAENLILKDPELSIYVDCLPFFFNEFKLVCVVRNPKDVIASFIQVYSKQGKTASIDELIGMVFNYYWRVSQSELSRAGRVHFLCFEKIMRNENSEFESLEEYLGYKVGRRGFGKVFFDFDHSDATYSENYGMPIRKLSGINTVFCDEEIVKIHNAFSGYNSIYKWW